MKKISIVINADDRLGHISPEIYGHFSEHLGRCIYNGIYVGENSPIPNTDGIRNDLLSEHILSLILSGLLIDLFHDLFLDLADSENFLHYLYQPHSAASDI